MVLTQKQKDDLNKGILEYLQNNQFESVAKKFEEELGYSFEENNKNASMKNILEKKWVSIIRLQKRDMELKQEIEELKQEIEELKKGKIGIISNPDQKGDKNDLIYPKIKHTLSSHRANVTRVAFHMQYSWCATSSEDGSAKVWDADSGELEATLKQHAGVVNSVAFDYSGKLLLTASSDMTLKIWDLQQFICTKTLQGHDHSVSHGEFSIDNNYILSCSRDKTIKLWEVNSGYCKKTLDGHSDWVRYVKFSQNGQKFASCSNDQSIIIWNYSNMEITTSIENAHDNVIEIMAWCGSDLEKSDLLPKKQNNQLNNIEQQQPEESKNNQNNQNSNNTNINNTQNSIFLCSGGRDNKVKLWNTQSGTLIHTFVGNDNWIRGIAFHPYIHHIMYTSSDDKSIRIWNLNTGKQVKKIHDAHSHFISSLSVANNYLLLVTGGFDFKLKIWDLKP